MHYDRVKRCFVFTNKACLKPSAMLFYDMPKLLSASEEICSEAYDFAACLPQHDAVNIFGAYTDSDAKPHQIEAIEWIIRCHGTGILAYGMGLGKTFIAIRSCQALQRRRVLIFCESHLKTNWAKEIAMWAPHASVCVCDGRQADVSRTVQFTIINKDILASNLEALQDSAPYDQIVIDECQRCGGWGTATYRALDIMCAAVRGQRGGILPMTGTLFKNSPMDAHTVLHLLEPKIAGGREAFELRFDPLGHRRQEVIGLMRRGRAPQWLIGKKWGEIKKLEKEKGKNGDVAGLRWLLSQYAIRKRYFDVFPDDGTVRETQFVSIDLDLTERQRRLLANSAVLEDDGKINTELSSLLRDVAAKKAPFVADHAMNWLSEHEGKKLVIAGWHVESQQIIKSTLEPFGVVQIAGTRTQKAKAEAKFAQDPESRVCLINLESGGTGLNLVSAADIYFSEVPWTSAAYEQVKARVDRMGQTSDTINYTVFLAADTPEGAKFGTVRKKSGLNDRYLD